MLSVDHFDHPVSFVKKMYTNVVIHARFGVDKLNNAKQILCTALQPTLLYWPEHA